MIVSIVSLDACRDAPGVAFLRAADIATEGGSNNAPNQEQTINQERIIRAREPTGFGRWDCNASMADVADRPARLTGPDDLPGFPASAGLAARRADGDGAGVAACHGSSMAIAKKSWTRFLRRPGDHVAGVGAGNLAHGFASPRRRGFAIVGNRFKRFCATIAQTDTASKYGIRPPIPTEGKDASSKVLAKAAAGKKIPRPTEKNMVFPNTGLGRPAFGKAAPRLSELLYR